MVTGSQLFQQLKDNAHYLTSTVMVQEEIKFLHINLNKSTKGSVEKDIHSENHRKNKHRMDLNPKPSNPLLSKASSSRF